VTDFTSKRVSATVAIGAIFVLELVALLHGVNGVALTASVGAIAGLGGFAVGRVASKNKEEV